MAMRHDEAFKFLFDLPEVCADTLRVAAPALWPHLDPASVRILRTGDSVAADLSKRQGDALFAVDLREGALADGRRPYLVAPTEFQSSDDAGMPDRVREYALRQLDTLRRQGVIPAGDTPPVLPLVVYDGAAPWKAADGLEPLRHLPPAAALHLGPYQPQAYVLLDLVRSRTDDWGEYNRPGAVARLLRTRSPEELSAALAEEFARFAGPPHRPFREALHAWAGELWTRLADGGELPTFAVLEGLEALDMTSMIEVRFAAWKEEQFGRARAEGVAEGVAQGRAEGVAEGVSHERMMLSRLAARRFGVAAGHAVAEAVAEVDDAADLERIGDLIVDCPTAERFLLAVAGVSGSQEFVPQEFGAREKSDRGELPTFAALEGLEALDMTSMIEVRIAAWKEEQFGRVRAEGVAQGRAEGVAEGVSHERMMLSRLAARRFGVAAGRAVAEAVAEVDDAADLERIGDLIVDCPTEERFLLALAGVSGRQEFVPQRFRASEESDRGELPTFAALEGLEALDMTSMIEVRFAAWKEEHFGRARAEGVAEGVAESVSRLRTMFSRQAARRFGAAAGRAVAEAVAEMDEPADLERIGDLIVDCSTEEGFLLALADVPSRQEPVT